MFESARKKRPIHPTLPDNSKRTKYQPPSEPIAQIIPAKTQPNWAISSSDDDTDDENGDDNSDDNSDDNTDKTGENIHKITSTPQSQSFQSSKTQIQDLHSLNTLNHTTMTVSNDSLFDSSLSLWDQQTLARKGHVKSEINLPHLSSDVQLIIKQKTVQKQNKKPQVDAPMPSEEITLENAAQFIDWRDV